MMCSRPGAAIIGNCLWKTPKSVHYVGHGILRLEFRSNAPSHNGRVGPSSDGCRTGYEPSFNRDLSTSASDAIFDEAATVQKVQFLCAGFALTGRAFFHSDPVGRGNLAWASWPGWGLRQHRDGGDKKQHAASENAQGSDHESCSLKSGARDSSTTIRFAAA
jgi:hypothetical protein